MHYIKIILTYQAKKLLYISRAHMLLCHDLHPIFGTGTVCVG